MFERSNTFSAMRSNEYSSKSYASKAHLFASKTIKFRKLEISRRAKTCQDCAESDKLYCTQCSSLRGATSQKVPQGTRVPVRDLSPVLRWL